MKNFISVYDNALERDECSSILKFFEESDVCENPDATDYCCKKPGKVGIGVEAKFKDSTDIGMTFNHGHHFVNQIIMKSLSKHLHEYMNENPELRLISKWGVSENYNIQKYTPGQGYYSLHCENCDVESNKRVLVWMFYLNTVPGDGGTYFSNYDFTTDAVEGRLVIWPAYWTHCHKGVISHSHKKYIATGWCEKVEKATPIKKIKN